MLFYRKRGITRLEHFTMWKLYVYWIHLTVICFTCGVVICEDFNHADDNHKHHDNESEHNNKKRDEISQDILHHISDGIHNMDTETAVSKLFVELNLVPCNNKSLDLSCNTVRDFYFATLKSFYYTLFIIDLLRCVFICFYSVFLTKICLDGIISHILLHY